MEYANSDSLLPQSPQVSAAQHIRKRTITTPTKLFCDHFPES